MCLLLCFDLIFLVEQFLHGFVITKKGEIVGTLTVPSGFDDDKHHWILLFSVVPMSFRIDERIRNNGRENRGVCWKAMTTRNCPRANN